MEVKLIRELQVNGDKTELLLEVDEEFLNMYRSDTGEKGFNQDSFNDWLKCLMECATDGESWRE